MFPRLLRALVTRFNWAYRDLYPDLWIIQRSFLFTLRLLHRHGAGWRDTTFYEEAFLRAYPKALSECEGHSYSPSEDAVPRCYRVRALERFAAFAGLAEIDPDPTLRPFAKQRRVRALPLLCAAVEFRA